MRIILRGARSGKLKKLSLSTKYLDFGSALHLVSYMTNNIDSIFAVLADPTRRAVIERLTQGPAAVSSLHAAHKMALPTFLKHLSRLESAGLIRTEKSGRVRTVHIEANALQDAENWISRQRGSWEARMDRLSALADQMQRTKS